MDVVLYTACKLTKLKDEDEEEKDETVSASENLQTIENIKTTLGCFQSEEDSFDESSRRDLQNFGNWRKSHFQYFASQNLEEEDSAKFSSSSNFHRSKLSNSENPQVLHTTEEQRDIRLDSPSAELSYPKMFPYQESFHQDSSSFRNLIESLHQEAKPVLGKHERFETGSSSMLYFPKLLRTEEDHEVVTNTQKLQIPNSDFQTTSEGNDDIFSSHYEYQQLDTEVPDEFDFSRDSQEHSQGKILSPQDWPSLEKNMDELSANLSSLSFSATLAATMQQIEDEQFSEKEKNT